MHDTSHTNPRPCRAKSIHKSCRVFVTEHSSEVKNHERRCRALNTAMDRCPVRSARQFKDGDSRMFGRLVILPYNF